MAADQDDRVDDQTEETDAAGVDSDAGEFSEPEEEDVTTDLDEFDDDLLEEGGEGEEGESEAEIDAVVELTSKEQSARSLKIRRAIERSMEERQLHDDLDYLDLDLDP